MCFAKPSYFKSQIVSFIVGSHENVKAIAYRYLSFCLDFVGQCVLHEVKHAF